MGSPARLATGVTPLDEWRPLWRNEPPSVRHVGISLRDAWFIRLLTDALGPVPSLVIGNSHGISTLLIAELLRPEPLDAIDAETSQGSSQGTQLTHRVALRLGLDVAVTAGFSPNDLESACRSSVYGFVLIDGEHTNEQLLLDYQGVVDRLDERCVIYCHDIGLRDMDAGWLKVRELAEPAGFRGFDLSASDFGSTVLVRGLPEIERMLERTCPGLRCHSSAYHAGLEVAMPSHFPDSDRLVLGPGQRVAFYGAGSDLEQYGHFMLSHPDRVAGLCDDNQGLVGTKRYGIAVSAGHTLASAKPDAIVISTHANRERVRARVAELIPHANVYPRPGLMSPVRVFCMPQ
jgi:hypothetical protein